MSDEMEKLGLDASNYIDEVEKMVKSMGTLNRVSQQVNVNLGNLEAIIKNKTLTIRKFNEAGQSYTAVLKEIGKETRNWKVQSLAISDAHKQHYLSVRELDASVKNLRENEKLATDIEEHRNAVLEKQADLFKKLQQQHLNRITASSIGAELQSKAIIDPNASPAEISRVQSQISRVTTLIQQGAVSAQRSMQIINAVQAGTAEVFSGAEARVANAARGIQRATNLVGGEYNQKLKETWANVNGLGKGYNQLAAEQEKFRTGIVDTTRWMGKLFLVITLRDAFYGFLTAMRSSLQTAEEFAVRIGEIQTIAQRAPLTFDAWTQAVINLSNASGRAVQDVGEGLYQTLSNQIAQGGDAIVFLNKALEFSRVTVATTAESVNLLSGALNAFKIDASETDRVAASLFKTIELGRVRATEMADSFGRIGVLANRLGVSLYETEAAITTLTIQGVKYSDASTQLTNVLNKLLKPSTDMKELLKIWGVTSGEAAIQTFTFAGVLRKLEEASKGSSDELADLFKDIRGIRGILGLTGSAFETFNENLVKVQNTTDYLTAKQILAKNVGVEWQKVTEQVKNTFIEFGQEAIKSGLTIVKALGGVDKITKNLIVSVKTLAEAYFLYKIALLAASPFQWRSVEIQKLMAIGNDRETATTIANTVVKQRLGTALTGLLSPMHLVAVGVTGLIYLWNKEQEAEKELEQQYLNSESNIAEAVHKRTEATIENERRQLDYQKKAIDERYTTLYNRFNRIYQLEIQLDDKLKTDLISTQAALKEAFSSNIKLLEQDITKINHLAELAKRTAEQARDLAVSITDQVNTKTFDNSIKGLTPDKQLDAIIKQATQNQANIVGLLKNPTDPEKAKQSFDQAKKNLQEQTTLIGQAEQIAQRALEKKKTLEEQIEEVIKRQTAKKVEEAALDQTTEDRRGLAGIHTQSKNPSSRLNQRNRSNQQDVINSDIDEKTKLAREEENRRDAEKLLKLRQELKEQNDVLTVAGKKLDNSKLQLDYQKQQVSVLEKFASTLDKINQAEERQLSKQKERLEKFKVLIDTLNGEKFKPENIKNAAQGTKVLNDFDSVVNSARGQGVILEESTIEKLAEHKKTLELAIQAELQKKKLEDIRAETTERQRLVKEEIEKGQKKIQDISSKFLTDIERLKEKQSELDSNGLNRFGLKGYQTVNPNVSSGEALDALPALIQSFSDKQDNKTFKALSDQFNLFKSGIDTAVHTGVLDPSKAFIKQPTAYDKGYSLQDALNDFQKNLADANKQVRDQVEAQKFLKTKAVSEAQVNKQIKIQEQSEDIAKFGKDYVNHINEANDAFQKINGTLQQFETKLRNVLGGDNKKVSYDSSGGSLGGITINLNSTGNNAQDALAIGKEILRLQRRGQLETA